MEKISPEIIEKAKTWLSEKYDANTRKQVQELIDNNPDELLESFYKNLEFGTGGLRGIMEDFLIVQLFLRFVIELQIVLPQLNLIYQI